MGGKFGQKKRKNDKPAQTTQNIVGPKIRKLRYQQGWTQAMLTARCARMGWNVGENLIAKIEAQYRCVTDRELVFLARALKVKLHDLFPDDAPTRKIK